MNDSVPSRGLSLATFTLLFVPFGLLLCAALLVPEILVPGGTPNLGFLDELFGIDDPALRPIPAGTTFLALNRTILTIWAATLWLIPALCLYVLSPRGGVPGPAARLCWTFAYLTFLVHFYYAAFIIFGGVAGTFEHMRTPIAATNFLLTAWWTFDVLVAWLASPMKKWVRLERTAAHIFIFTVFVVTELFLRPTAIRYLGMALLVSVAVSLLVRLTRPWKPGKELSPMKTSDDKHIKISPAKFGFVLALFLILMGLAHGWAELAHDKDAKLKKHRDADRADQIQKAKDKGDPPPVLPAVGPALTAVYFRIVFTIWVTLVLVTPAFCFYIMRRPDTTSNYWVLFWTFSYLAYLWHFFWAVFILFAGDFHEVLNSPQGANPNPEKVVDNPIPDLILTVWWGIDVLLAWIITYNNRLVQLQRGALQLFAFMAFFGASVLAAKAGLISHLLGLAMFLAATGFFALRVVVRQMDPQSFLGTLYIQTFVLINKFRPWHKLPTWLGLMNLAALREVLRAKNLHGTDPVPITNPAGRRPEPTIDGNDVRERTFDGYFNDVRKPEMGSDSISEEGTPLGRVIQSSPGARFGRNIPLDLAFPKEDMLLKPSPREVSRRLLARDKFKPATILNLLAAAWIQFETHDWFFHGEPIDANPFNIDLKAGDTWGAPQMVIRRTRPDPTRDYDKEADDSRQNPSRKRYPPTYVNSETHWWDASQIYGDDDGRQAKLRSDPNTNQLLPDGKMYLNNDLLGQDPTTGVEMSGFTGNWWLGLTLLHTLFTREHNAICDALRTAYPDQREWPDERIFQTARLVNAAVIAKIHTVDWTTAILPNAALQIAMNANWSGLLSGPIKELFGRLSENETFSGIPGSVTNHHTADYALTEEFVSVYRLHPLIPDGLNVYSLSTGRPMKSFTMREIAGKSSRDNVLKDGITMADVFYSFGVANPGALELKNYPDFLRDFQRLDDNNNPIERVDLAAVDIMRDRERGVPRYNAFRQLFHMPRVSSFEELNPTYAKELADVYDNDIDNVDLMVGMFAEKLPDGFGFSDTAFRVFILMASRRLKSDRFFTTDFNESVYSQVGFEWVNKTGMREVLLRHFPDLAPVLRGVANVFAPWKTVDQTRTYQPHEGDKPT